MHFLYRGGTHFQTLAQIRQIRKLGETEVELADWKLNETDEQGKTNKSTDSPRSQARLT